MAKYKPLTAVERRRRKEIRELIQRARDSAIHKRSYGLAFAARLLDDLADIAEKYLKGLEHGQNKN